LLGFANPTTKRLDVSESVRGDGFRRGEQNRNSLFCAGCRMLITGR
jgi:hypothetical protein